MPLASAESVVIAYLTGAFPDPIRVLSETPAGMTGDPAVIQVTRFGGSDSVYTLDVANVDVDVFAKDRETATDLAEQVRTSLRLHAEGQTVAGGFIAAVTTLSAPNWAPYDNTSLRRLTASYRIAIRSIP